MGSPLFDVSQIYKHVIPHGLTREVKLSSSPICTRDVVISCITHTSLNALHSDRRDHPSFGGLRNLDRKRLGTYQGKE